MTVVLLSVMTRVAVVTGAASGIGRAIATALVLRGDTVVVTDLNGDKAKEVAERLTGHGPGQAGAAQLDVTDAAAVGQVVRAARAEHGKLDLMINNAGVIIAGAVEDLGLEHWNLAVDVNLRGVIHGVHAAYPIMLEQGCGHIVNMASVAGLAPFPMIAPYAATKHAVVGLSKTLRAEAAARGVKVTVVCPGMTNTGFTPNPGLPPVPSAQRITALESKGPAFQPEQLAKAVLHGIDRNKAVVIAPGSAHLVSGLYRHFPRLADRAGQWLARAAAQRGVIKS
ncbi:MULTISPECIES: SDR family oxidoreductase [unclassified Crossiella]|uniref:SDR family NAD(P)-dependent oxidoreductase n=1 Tax=unclassified Crossiella TaxID=2620835 RepID=UPI001FFFD7B9|nr:MULTISPECIES: SDR family oxidoreductase [unclassified Crossiella]MCK2242507.1 SDR family oxidoreductase [Crossiella sp. S99.2]MCK2254463.1 SDR family oxidoreductase [Crossiella sp. S99.1]